MKTLLGPSYNYQLEPFTYPLFWDITRDMRDNTWTPEEIGVGEDVATYKRLMASDDPQDKGKIHYLHALMGQLTAMDIARSEESLIYLVLLILPEEVRHFLIRMMWEERLHTESYRYTIQNFGIPETGPNSIYELWMRVPEMRTRVLYAEKETEPLQKLVQTMWSKRAQLIKEPYVTETFLSSIEDKQTILRSLIFWFLIFEKVWFLINLSGPLQHIARTRPSGPREFQGVAEQFRFIARDEYQHVRGGVELIRAFTTEYPEVITDAFIKSIQKMYNDCLALESSFAYYCSSVCPLAGYSTQDHIETSKYFANLGTRAIGFLPDPFPNAHHKFPWMSEVMDIKQEGNFFETRIKEYRSGSDLGLDQIGAWDGQALFDHLVKDGKK